MGLAGAFIAQTALAADLPTAGPAPVFPALPPLFAFSDTSLSYDLETRATDPGSSAKFIKNKAILTHVDAWIYGTNFVSASIAKSNSLDPVSPVLTNATPPYSYPGSYEQAAEFYGIYRGTLSGNALTHSKMFNFGFIKDISLEAGGDIETEDNAIAPEKRALVGGLQFLFNVPGNVSLAVMAYHEWNHNAIAATGSSFVVYTPTGVQVSLPPSATSGPSNANFNTITGNVDYNTTVDFETVYIEPLEFTHLPLVFNGFFNVILPKGLNPGLSAVGTPQYTRTEILTENRLTLDIGKLTFGRPHVLDGFVGYKFWYNKFGSNASYGQPSYLPGDYESQVIAGLTWHLQN